MKNLSDFLNAKRGVAAIEFAIMLPFLLIVFFGTYQVATYIMATRKVDNVANDIAYLLSREGQIATGTTKIGGAAKLDAIAQNVIPFLIYPYKFRDSSGSLVNDSQVSIKYVGLPNFATNSSSSNTTAPTCPATEARTVRLMWMHNYPSNAIAAPEIKSTFTLNKASVKPCDTANLSSLCPYTCKTSSAATSLFNSIYSEDGYGERAAIVYPGQAYILVNYTYKFSSLLNYTGPSSSIMSGILPNRVEKIASYAVRALWTDANNNNTVEAAELVNNMHVCTDCNVYTSKKDTPTATGTEPGLVSASTPVGLRQFCATATNNWGSCAF